MIQDIPDVDWMLRPFADHVITAFGSERVMWGSDWPVCQLQAEYGSWHDSAQQLTGDLPQSARDDIFGGSAARFYRLG